MNAVRRIVVIATLGISIGACGRRAPVVSVAPTAQSAVASGPCASVAAEDPADWLPIQGDGFSLCLPPHWQHDATSAWGGGSNVRWGRGPRPRLPSEGKELAGSVYEAARENRSFSEMIGDQRAELRTGPSPHGYYTGVYWTSSGFWVDGTASTKRTVDLEFAIYRSVRFRAP